MPAVVVANVVKRYGTNTAIGGISFTVGEGEVLALLGPNGAGKTSLVEILEGHRQRTSGDVSVLGYDPATGGREFRERVGIVLQEGGLQPDLTVRETVSAHAMLYPHPRGVDDVIAVVGITEKAKARVKTLSGGQRRRLELALALAGDPDLIFLDEPTTGFDPSARRQAWDLVKALRGFGKTILLTTHYMDEAQALADRIIVVARGQIVAEGTPANLAGRDRLEARIRFRLPDGATLASLPPSGQRGALRDGAVNIATDTPTPVLHELTAWAVAQGIELDGLVVERPSLEDVYLQLTGERQ